MRRFVCFFAFILAPAFATENALSKQLDAIVAKHKVPGLAAVALRGDTIVAEAFVGVRKLGDTTPLSRDDRFHLGSDTKAMTATLAAMFVEEEKLAWTSSPGSVLGSVIPGIATAWKDTTLQQLLTHRAGLKANHGFGFHRKFSESTLSGQRLLLAGEVLKREPDHPPGTKFLYSNTGYALAGTMLEQLSGRSWEDLMRERLFAPLGITSGGFGAPGTSGAVTAPWGHTPDGTPIDPGSQAADNAATIGPAGTAHMTMADWTKFAALHLRGDPANPHSAARLLKSETFERLHRAAPGQSYAGGWSIGTRPWAKGPRDGDIGRVLTHAGSNTVWFCVAWLAPEIDFAVLIACNQGGPAATKACDEAAGALIRDFATPAK